MGTYKKYTYKNTHLKKLFKFFLKNKLFSIQNKK